MKHTININADKDTLDELTDVYSGFLMETFDNYGTTGEQPEECNAIRVDAHNIILCITDEHWANLWDQIEAYGFDVEITE